MALYGYWRCSTNLQDQERQVIALKEEGVPEDNIFGDKSCPGMIRADGINPPTRIIMRPARAALHIANARTKGFPTNPILH